MDAGLGVNTPLPHVNTPPGTQPVESKPFTNLDDFKFVRYRHYKTPTTTPTYTTELEDAKLVLNEMRRMIREYEPKRLRPKLPVDDRVDASLLLIMRRGRDAVLLAFAYYLDEDPAPWVMNEKDGLLYADSLKWFCDNFRTYYDEAVARSARVADNKERKRVAEEKEKQRETQRRLTEYLSLLQVPADWFGLSDGERDWYGEVSTCADNPGEVSEWATNFSAEIYHRFQSYSAADTVERASRFSFGLLNDMSEKWGGHDDFEWLYHKVRDAARERDLVRLTDLKNKVVVFYTRRNEERGWRARDVHP